MIGACWRQESCGNPAESGPFDSYTGIPMQVLEAEVYLLSIYAKNDQSDMTAADRKAMKRFVEGLKDAKKQAGK